MRLWTLHPKYLDSKGLVALWREGLLAQAVLRGETKGYRHHPQLIRFQEQSLPLSCIAAYLRDIHHEALKRKYRFDQAKIFSKDTCKNMIETEGQLQYEWRHFKAKIKDRSPIWYERIRHIEKPDPHPLFHIVEGDVREWEKRKAR